MHASLASRRRSELSRQIFSSTAYPLLPHRTAFPEAYRGGAVDLEAKKALLLSLSPALAEAERVRRADCAAAEAFTRTKVGKATNKNRLSSFEYRDVDTDEVIDDSEYERRFVDILLRVFLSVYV